MSPVETMTWSWLSTGSFPSVRSAISLQRTYRLHTLSACFSAELRNQLANVPWRKRTRWNPLREAIALPPVNARAVRRELHSRHQVSTVVHPVAFTFVGYRNNGEIKPFRFLQSVPITLVMFSQYGCGCVNTANCVNFVVFSLTASHPLSPSVWQDTACRAKKCSSAEKLITMCGSAQAQSRSPRLVLALLRN